MFENYVNCIPYKIMNIGSFLNLSSKYFNFHNFTLLSKIGKGCFKFTEYIVFFNRILSHLILYYSKRFITITKTITKWRSLKTIGWLLCWVLAHSAYKLQKNRCCFWLWLKTRVLLTYFKKMLIDNVSRLRRKKIKKKKKSGSRSVALSSTRFKNNRTQYALVILAKYLNIVFCIDRWSRGNLLRTI